MFYPQYILLAILAVIVAIIAVVVAVIATVIAVIAETALPYKRSRKGLAIDVTKMSGIAIGLCFMAAWGYLRYGVWQAKMRGSPPPYSV